MLSGRKVLDVSAVLVIGSFVSMHEHKVLAKPAAFVAKDESRFTLLIAAVVADDRDGDV